MASASAKFQGPEFISYEATARHPYGFLQVIFAYYVVDCGIVVAGLAIAGAAAVCAHELRDLE